MVEIEEKKGYFNCLRENIALKLVVRFGFVYQKFDRKFLKNLNSNFH